MTEDYFSQIHESQMVLTWDCENKVSIRFKRLCEPLEAMNYDSRSKIVGKGERDSLIEMGKFGRDAYRL